MNRPLRTTAHLGAWVRNERLNQRLTQTQLAQKCRVSRELLGRIEAGAVRTETARVLRVISTLGYALTPVPLSPPANDENTIGDDVSTNSSRS